MNRNEDVRKNQKGICEHILLICLSLLTLFLFYLMISIVSDHGKGFNDLQQKRTQYSQYLLQMQPKLEPDENDNPSIKQYMTTQTEESFQNKIEKQEQKPQVAEKGSEEPEGYEEKKPKKRIYKPKQGYVKKEKKKKPQISCYFPNINPSLFPIGQPTSTFDLFIKAYKLIQSSLPYNDAETILLYKELPICAIVFQSETDKDQEIIASINNQPYKNVKVVRTKPLQNYYDYKQFFHRECDKFSIIFFAKEKLKKTGLSFINKVYQENNVWATCEPEGMAGVFEFHSFYLKLYDNVELNDFTGQNRQYLQGKSSMLFTILSLMELSKIHTHKADNSEFFVKIPRKFRREEFAAEIFPEEKQIFLKRNPYQTLYSLSQNHKIDEKQNYQNMMKLLKGEESNYGEVHFITKYKMVRASQYLELKNLPENHSLFLRERLSLKRKYWRYWRDKEDTRFCLVIISHNNIQNDRYKKNLQTVKYQKYSNYHIVFIDDDSSDNTFEKVKQFSFQYQWKENEDIFFIKNSQRKYSTYNIKNACDNYCKAGEVLIILDGDDELVGTHTFQLINSFYQFTQKPWIVYTSFFSNLYTYGTSKPPSNYEFSYESRTRKHIIGALRTFKRELYERIQEKDHKDKDGKWLDTLYDEAMQYPMIQMAGIQRINYIPEICYLYNKNYGDNDDSSEQKILHRNQIFMDIEERTPYQPIPQLD